MKTLEKHNIEEIVQLINDSNILAIPTDTIYGLVAKVDDTTAIDKIYEIKKRNKDKPLPVLVGTWKQAEKIGKIGFFLKRHITNEYPAGKVTLIVKKKHGLKSPYWEKYDTLAIRVSDDSFIKILCHEVGPLVATSCNLSEEKPYASPYEINLVGVDYVVDGGVLDNTPSIIYDTITKKILRA